MGTVISIALGFAAGLVLDDAIKAVENLTRELKARRRAESEPDR